MLRLFDIFFALLGLIFGLPVLLLISIIGLFDTGSPIFLQKRVGRHKKPFTLVKFRTMKKDTASVGTHLADAAAITPLGSFLRRTKLDELPQLWNVLTGDMSLVGPAPAYSTRRSWLLSANNAASSTPAPALPASPRSTKSICRRQGCWLKPMQKCWQI